MITLREDQVEAVDSVLTLWNDGIQRPFGIAATGYGKTIVFVFMCSQLARAGHKPVIFVARDELVRQTVDKIRRIDPSLSIGIIQAEKNELHGDITVASIQTISRQARLNRIPRDRFDRIICDEAHWSSAPSWVRALTYFGAFDEASDTKVLGVTATMTRLGSVQPGGKQLGEIWEKEAFHYDTRWCIEQGFLVRPDAVTVVIPKLDTRGVSTRGGDFVDGDLGKAMSQADAGPIIAKAYLEHGRNEAGELRRAIGFAPTIATARQFMEDFRAAGIASELVIGETPIHERQAIYDATRAGTNKVIWSVGVLTTGFDLPAVEVIIMARPTKSKGLYIQCVGRGLRLSPETGKVSARILDAVGVSRHGLASIVDLELDPPKPPKDPDGDPKLRGPRRPGDPVETPGEVAFVAVDPFTGTLTSAKRSKKAWKLTKQGRFYLPSHRAGVDWIFLHKDAVLGTWSVGRMPTQGARKAIRLGDNMTFLEAVALAEKNHDYGGKPAPKLYGPPSPGQLNFLARFVSEIPENADKQTVTDMLDYELASRALD